MNKECSECKRVLSLENFSKRKCTKDGLNHRCKICVKTYMARQHLVRRNRPENVEKRRIESEKKRLIRLSKVSTFNKKEYSKKYFELHREKSRLRCQQRYNDLKDNSEFKLSEKIRKAEYYRTNKHKFRAIEARRHFLQKSAKLHCLTSEDLLDIKTYYYVSKILTETTCVRYNVDHIIPLMNKKVCGLHVPWNLRVLEESTNKSKGNKFYPELGIDFSAEYYRKHSFKTYSKT